jgi:hypothetical protein
MKENRYHLFSGNLHVFARKGVPCKLFEKSFVVLEKHGKNGLKRAEYRHSKGDRIVTAYYGSLRKFTRFCEKRGTLQIAIITERSSETAQSGNINEYWGTHRFLLRFLFAAASICRRLS